jgi:hypothetical protein
MLSRIPWGADHTLMLHFLQLSHVFFLVPVLIVPLIIHWLNQRHPRRFRFSSVDQLKKTMAGRSKPSRWRHYIMLLLRTLALLLLLLAFLHPLFMQQAAPQRNLRHTIILLDHSLSMTYQESGSSPQKRALQELRRLLDQMTPQDRFNLILVNRQPTPAFPDFSTNRAGALRFVETAPEALAEADFSAANAIAASLAVQASSAPDVYYFSDFQRKNWSNVRFDALPENCRLHFVNVATSSERGNQSVQEISLDQEVVIEGGSVDCKVRVANHSPQAWQGKVEAGFQDLPLAVKDVSIAPWSETDVMMTLPVRHHGMLRMFARIPRDALTADNQRHQVIRVKAREPVVLLDGNANVTDFGEPHTFLTTAVNPYNQNQGTYIPRAVDAKTFTRSILSTTTRVVACRLPALTDEQANAIVAYLRNGGGMLWFLDGRKDAENLAKLTAISGNAMPLRVTQKLSQDDLKDGAMKVAYADVNSRFLRLFQGERMQNLNLLEFYEMYRAAATQNGKILLRYADETPAMAECNVGLGSLVICNFSVAEASSNLARQRLFPVWIHEILLRMNHNNGSSMDAFTVGESITGQAWAAETLGLSLKDPSGELMKSAKFSPQGDMLRVTFPTKQAGFYRMTASNQQDLMCYAVNVSKEESDLRSIDPTVLPQRAGDHLTSSHETNSQIDFSAIMRGSPAYHWFILAALAILLLETCLFKKPRTTS